MRRIVALKGDKPIGIYEKIEEVILATGVSKEGILRNLRNVGPKVVKGYRFIWEVTKEDLKKKKS